VDSLVKELVEIVGASAVLSEPDELMVYECDGLPQHKYLPRAVVFPKSTEEVSRVIKVLARAEVPLAPRGAGTGLSGGALALDRGVVIELAKMRRLLELDPVNGRVRVETGFINAHVTREAAKYGLYYAPDPSSQASCTIGGNIAENAGGIHCLKYGTTVDHILSARVVLPDGEILELESPETGAAGLDLLGVFIGSEGTFGIATEATLRLVHNAPDIRTLLADFLDVEDASRAVSAIIAEGLIPAALEMIDGAIIRAVEQSVFAAGMPIDAQAALLIELDGIAAGLDVDVQRAEAICVANGARSVKVAEDEYARKKLWAARKGAFGAMGRISPDLMLQDAVVPRSKLPEVLRDAFRIGAKYGLLVANVFHAGDGNLHPFICYDSRIPGEVERVQEAGRELIETCVRAGGTITGEHGVGFDKREYLPLIFSQDDMDTMLGVRAAFDPSGLFNPGKIIPLLSGCGEGRRFSTVPVTSAETPVDSLPIEQPVVTAEGFIDLVRKSTFASMPQFTVRTAFDRINAAIEVERIVGSQYVTAEPELIVEPGSPGETREIFDLAMRNRWPVIPAGAGTWLDAGYTSRGDCVIVKTSRMSRIVEHEPADLIVTAEAGITLASLNRYLVNAGRQWLPLDPPDDGRATIGGVAATGMGGAQSMAYGMPRSSILGMHFLRADGRIIKAGGRVVKNVAGYDLCKLLTGSFGILGMILDLTFKLRPVPVRDITVIADGEIADLLRFGKAIGEGRLGPVALELLSAETGQVVDETYFGRTPLLMARFVGNGKSVDFQIRQALALAGNEGVQSSIRESDEGFWNRLASLPVQFAEGPIWRAKLKPAALQASLVDFDFPPLWHAGLGDGSLRAMHKDSVGVVEQLQGYRKKIEACGGKFALENASKSVKEAVGVWGEIPGERLMRRVKAELDPEGLLSPGRFWG
jgi:glycolate oxidase subunit GlcD